MDTGIQTMGDFALKQATAVPGTAKLPANGNIDKTAQDFEAMFASQMFQPMFETIGVDKEFGGGHGEEVMRSFLVQEYGKIAAKSGTLGIAAAVKREMIETQARASQASTNGGVNALVQ